MADKPIKSYRDAVVFLIAHGHQLSIGKFGIDTQLGRINREPDGYFSEKALLAYAEAYVGTDQRGQNIGRPLAGTGAPSVAVAQQARLKADVKLKTMQAERLKLKLDVEKGLLIELSKHEQALGARLAFFKNEIEAVAPHIADELINDFGVPLKMREEVMRWWETRAYKWLDAFSKEKEFTVDLDLETISPGLMVGGNRTLGKLRAHSREAAKKDDLAKKARAEAKARGGLVIGKLKASKLTPSVVKSNTSKKGPVKDTKKETLKKPRGKAKTK